MALPQDRADKEPLKTLAGRIWRAARLAARAFREYQGMNQAASLAYYALLSFIPLVFLCLAVAGMLWNDPVKLQDFFFRELEFITPWLRDLLYQHTLRLVQTAPKLGFMSLGFILWTSGLFFAMLQANLLLPWAKEHDHTSGFLTRLIPWLIGPALGFLLILTMLAMNLVSYVPLDWLPFKILPEVWTWLLLSLLIILFYWILLPRRASLAAMASLSLLLSGASQLLTLLFGHVITRLPNYSLVYGSLAGLVLFLLWLCYNMILILWGGHVIRLWTAGVGMEEK